MDPTTNDPNINPAPSADDATNGLPPVDPTPPSEPAPFPAVDQPAVPPATDAFSGDTSPADPAAIGSTVAPTEPSPAPTEAPAMDLPAVDPTPSVDASPVSGVSTPTDDTATPATDGTGSTPDANQQLGSF